MQNYRPLTEEEIQALSRQGCSAEDWTAVNVDEAFSPEYLRNVGFSGDVSLGVFDRVIHFDDGYSVHSGISNATLRDVTIGDNCLIENIGGYIFNYDIGDDCVLVNVGRLSSAGEATYGRGNTISVMDEAGNGNVTIFEGLTANVAAFMTAHSADTALRSALRKLVRDSIDAATPQRGYIGNGVKIINTREVTNSIIMNGCEINGASRLSECTLVTIPNDIDSSILIGSDVILENSIVAANAAVLDGAKVDNCFVGEACHVGKGASTESTLMFANSWIDNGETCAAFCGPFSVSHHKSSLLIGGQYSFYNAGSATNFSNHAYKMGPIHWGIMERGAKTASGCHLLWPARIGAFSMCMGKIENHPDTRHLPFSYVFGTASGTTIVPGRNLTTVGTYRDVGKWPRRDMRVAAGKNSIINFEWLNPMTVKECIDGIQLLEKLQNEQGSSMASYLYNGCNIRNQSLQRGIKYYSMAIRLFIGETMKRHTDGDIPKTSIGSGEWHDLAGLLLPEECEQELTENIKNGNIASYEDLLAEMRGINDHYEDYKWSWAYKTILDFYGIETLGDDDIQRISDDYDNARKEWLNAVKYDAEKEFQLGDVDEGTLNDFISKLQ